ncbi:hypothetical protein B566_EDAN004218 [Ephemera danica]|nr:hypothetical protein B566_EDAN004218 [Ephemera danica]
MLIDDSGLSCGRQNDYRIATVAPRATFQSYRLTSKNIRPFMFVGSVNGRHRHEFRIRPDVNGVFVQENTAACSLNRGTASAETPLTLHSSWADKIVQGSDSIKQALMLSSEVMLHPACSATPFHRKTSSDDTFGQRTERKKRHTRSSGRLSENYNIFWISSEILNVLVDPLESKYLVQHGGVARPVPTWWKDVLSAKFMKCDCTCTIELYKRPVPTWWKDVLSAYDGTANWEIMKS